MINSNMPGVKHRRSRVSDGIDIGVYTWKMPDGKILGNAEGDVLSVQARRGDLVAMTRISMFVKKELGILSGEPYFLEGAVKLTEYEHAGQMEQMINGQMPDYDLGSLKDDMKRARR
jgi:hypothetical protein